MTPGRRPLLELAARIATLAGIPAGALDADLRTDPARVTAAIRQGLLAHARRQAQSSGLGPGPAAFAVMDTDGYPVDGATAAADQAAEVTRVAFSPRLVLIVDQFEELFTQCTDEQERRAFIHALCAAAGTTAAAPLPGGGGMPGMLSPRDASALVVIGMRTDFYARSAAYPELVPYLQDCQVLVGPMDHDGLCAAIERPAASAGLIVDAGLVEVLLTDLGLHPHLISPLASAQATGKEADSGQVRPTGYSYEAGRLPLLAYALQQTWQHREGRRLTVAAYQARGGIDGAVARTAETVYERFDTDGKQAARRLLLRLVSPGEGTADTRRRVSVTELTGATELAGPTNTPQVATAQAVLTDLIQARLLTADTRTDGKDTVEISHEALLWAWPRLREWLNQDRAGQRIRRDLTDAAHAWQAQGREPSQLFAGTRLAVARAWAASHGQDLNPDERAFLSACQQRERRATRLRRAAVTALAVLTLVAAGTAGIAFYSNSRAVSERNQAITNEVFARAAQLQVTDPSLAAQLDLVAHQRDPTQASTSLLLDTANNPLSNPLTGPTGNAWSVAFSPDGHTLAAGSGDDKIWLWNVTDPAHPSQIGQPLTGPTGAVDSVAFSPDGHTLAAGSADDKIWLWNVTDPAQATLTGERPLTGTGNVVWTVAFSPDGHTLAAGSEYDYGGMIPLLDLDVDHAIDRICATTSGNLTPEQWAHYIPQLPYDPPCRHQ